MDKEYIKLEENINNKKIVSKLFSIKNIKIIILIILVVIALIIFLGFNEKSDNANTQETSNNYNSTYLSSLDYCKAIEEKLESVLSNVSGAGKVSVAVSVEGSPEYVYATDSDNKTSNSNGGSTTTSSSSPIIITSGGSSSALILTENMPKVKGVIVVASGASDIGVRLDLLNSVSKLLDLSIDKISVLKGN